MKNNCILIVEDDLVSCELFRELFSREKLYPIIIVHNGEEAIEICRKDHGIGMVLLDYKLPGIDGYETLQEIKKIRRDLPVIVQTACVYEGDRADYLDCGFDDYICKPINYQELLRVIHKFNKQSLN